MSAAAASEPVRSAAALHAATRDRHWWALMLAGPAAWIALIVAGVPLPAGQPAAMSLLYGIVLYPVLEEIVFRGMLQSWLLQFAALKQRAGPISLANLVTSLVFAASHLLSQTPLQAALILLPSLAFGWAFERYRHVAPSIVLHAFYNAGFLWLFTA